MAKETLVNAPRELNFYGEKAESINHGFAITSLRNPSDRYSFSRGERIFANCQDDSVKVPVVVISNETLPLSEQPIPVLALDGAFSAQEAAEILKPYPTYENTTANSLMQAIVFLQAEKFDSLPKEFQSRLVDPENSIMSLIKDSRFREIFFPTMCYWFASKVGGLPKWSDFLSENELVTQEELVWLRHPAARFQSAGPEAMYQAMESSHHELLRLISMDPDNPFFRPYVLGFINGNK